MSDLSHSCQLEWQALQPELTQFVAPTQSHQSTDFFDLQPRASLAVRQFLQNSHRSLLVLKADDQYEYADLLEKFIAVQQKPLSVVGVNYVVEQADSFSFARVYAEPAQSVEDNFAAKKTVASALYFDNASLFGSIRIHPLSHDIQLNSGLVHQLNNGVLILSVAALLAQADYWARLKQILLEGRFDWYSAHPFKPLPCNIPSYPLQLKVILLGNREELATLAEFEPDLYALADYSEIESYISIEQAQAQTQWQQYVQAVAQQQGLPPLSENGLNKLYQLLVRESENRILINASPLHLRHWLQDGAQFAQHNQLTAVDFQQVFTQKTQLQGYLREQAYADILYEQHYVATEGDIVGQINGLSVVEFAGNPMAFGEPSRISCIVQFGDGEVIDIERKSELAGNLHGKSMMIAESCLSHILALPSQLPFSASLVFEQSYGEIDGDSASLAAFLVLVSALADVEIPQSIAVTGSIDQFGLVHSVGGVNDKIEGFFAICQKRGLTGKQGVIIPEATIHQLSLSDEVVTAVKNQQFFIWAVGDVFEACEILFGRKLLAEEEQEREPTLAQLINQRIELRGEGRGGLSFWKKLFN